MTLTYEAAAKSKQGKNTVQGSAPYILNIKCYISIFTAERSLIFFRKFQKNLYSASDEFVEGEVCRMSCINRVAALDNT